MLLDRYLLTGNMDDLQAATSKVEATPEDHLNRAEQLNSLADMLSHRYRRAGNIDDLQAAISKAELAVSTKPPIEQNC